MGIESPWDYHHDCSINHRVHITCCGIKSPWRHSNGHRSIQLHSFSGGNEDMLWRAGAAGYHGVLPNHWSGESLVSRRQMPAGRTVGLGLWLWNIFGMFLHFGFFGFNDSEPSLLDQSAISHCYTKLRTVVYQWLLSIRRVNDLNILELRFPIFLCFAVISH